MALKDSDFDNPATCPCPLPDCTFTVPAPPDENDVNALRKCAWDLAQHTFFDHDSPSTAAYLLVAFDRSRHQTVTEESSMILLLLTGAIGTEHVAREEANRAR